MALVIAAASLLQIPLSARAQGAQGVTQGSDLIVEARDAFRKKDRNRLAQLRAAVVAAQQPLAGWVDYWDMTNRLPELAQPDLDAFYSRWGGSYVEDRLRNDWLLELGKRRDWRNFAADFARFRMNDDREVTCYALLTDQLDGKDVHDAARSAWFAQRESDNGCSLMASSLYEARVFTAADIWRKARLAMDAGRPQSARLAVLNLGAVQASTVQDLGDAPARYLARNPPSGRMGRDSAELATLALMRLAASDPDAAANSLNERWERALPADLASWSWAAVAKQAAVKLSPDASDHFQRADLLAAKVSDKPGRDTDWSEEMLAWKARAALRANGGKGRWQQVMQAINAMGVAEQRDPAWVYWKARALQALAIYSQEGAAMAAQSVELMGSIAGQFHFYGKLAADNLNQPVNLPPRPQPLTAPERDAAANHAGLARAVQLISIGLRSEGVREWNFSLRGLGDRELLAAAQLACEREIWDRCINTSDRTRSVIDMAQRFPTPFRKQVLARTKEIGLDPAYVYGLIRQESRFIMDTRSHVGASGLMQIMPATARWTANRIGLPYSQDQISDRDTNLKLGTSYLKLVLDDFGGSQPLAAAAYNAGPGRPRKWREGPLLEPAVWAENIPFSETRDYVKKVLSNAVYYSAMLSGEVQSLKSRLGAPIGPRDPNLPDPSKELP